MRFFQSYTPVWATLSLVVASACSGSPSGSTGPQANFGSIEVIVSTMGVMLDSNGYLVVIDEELSQPVGVNETVEFSRLAVGFYEISLTGVAPNCEVAEPNLRPITVSRDVMKTVLFSVTCSTP